MEKPDLAKLLELSGAVPGCQENTLTATLIELHDIFFGVETSTVEEMVKVAEAVLAKLGINLKSKAERMRPSNKASAMLEAMATMTVVLLVDNVSSKTTAWRLQRLEDILLPTILKHPLTHDALRTVALRTPFQFFCDSRPRQENSTVFKTLSKWKLMNGWNFLPEDGKKSQILQFFGDDTGQRNESDYSCTCELKSSSSSTLPHKLLRNGIRSRMDVVGGSLAPKGIPSYMLSKRRAPVVREEYQPGQTWSKILSAMPDGDDTHLSHTVRPVGCDQDEQDVPACDSEDSCSIITYETPIKRARKGIGVVPPSPDHSQNFLNIN